jgi:hypothetical protein
VTAWYDVLGTELAIYAIKALYLRLFAQGGGTRKNRR